jgi:1-acyl-sn-glycerol-3-phosphate acyltransferase
LADPFDEIRPYRDDEVAPVLARLYHDREFLGMLAGYRLGTMARWVPGLARTLVRFALKRQLRGVTDVSGMQMIIREYVERAIDRSTGGFTVSGLDGLDPGRAYLYMSNHRDIVMDPAFTNYALHRGHFDTARIAVGDNLLTKPWVSDLMRLNKSFIVKRNVAGPRQLLAASKNLSAYIRHSLEEGAPIWIAQREGRAKDGLDRTEPAVIKMLAMSRGKGEASFAEHIERLAIVPVAISYELDPCDALKASEVYQRATTGSYQKGEQEDIASIGQGIAGAKGRVHVTFGTPLGGGLETPEAVAAAIDRQVVAGYCLHPTNLYAWRMLHGDDAALPPDLYLEEGDCGREEFSARIQAMPEAHRPYALAIYANAVASKLGLAGEATAAGADSAC